MEALRLGVFVVLSGRRPTLYAAGPLSAGCVVRLQQFHAVLLAGIGGQHDDSTKEQAMNLKVNPKPITFKTAMSVIFWGAIEGVFISGVLVALVSLTGYGLAMTLADAAMLVAAFPVLRLVDWTSKRRNHVKSMQAGIDLGSIAQRRGVVGLTYEDEFSTIAASAPSSVEEVTVGESDEAPRVPVPQPIVEVRDPVAAPATVYNQVVASSLAALAGETQASVTKQ
jgi:hypothetical protein